VRAIMTKIIQGIKSYFSDKRNRSVHIIAGVSGLIASIFSLIGFYDRIVLFGIAIGFNILRMKYIP
jgi:hypothetical protein